MTNPDVSPEDLAFLIKIGQVKTDQAKTPDTKKTEE